MKILFSILLLLLLPAICVAYNPATCILGPGDGTGGSPTDDYTDFSTGRNSDHTWKAFRWTAGASGEAYVFGIYIKEMPSPSSVTSVDLQFSVYEDCGVGCMGDLKVWGYALNYDFSTIGVGRHYFDIQNVASGNNRTITAGTKYWIAWRSDATPTANEEYMFFCRKSAANPYPTGLNGHGDGGMKQGADWIATHPSFDTTPPTGADFNDSGLDYEDDYYGWTVWSKSDIAISEIVLILQILSGLSPSQNDLQRDLNGDGKIGLQEAVYMLQKAAELR